MPLFKVHGKRPPRLNDPASVTTLPPPGRRPNCASSHPEAAAALKVEPFSYTGTPEAAINAVRDVVAKLPGAEVQYVSPGRYLYATFMSKKLQFVDDFECLVRPEDESGSTVIDVRSASRVGYGDMGVNAKRVADIRAALKPETAP